MQHDGRVISLKWLTKLENIPTNILDLAPIDIGCGTNYLKDLTIIVYKKKLQ